METRQAKANKMETQGNSDLVSNNSANVEKDSPSDINIAAALKRIENTTSTTNYNVSAMTSDIQNIKSDIINIRDSLGSTTQTAQDALAKACSVDIQLKTVNVDVDNLKLELAKVRHENKELKDSLVRNEAQNRRNNLIFKGIPETDSEVPLQIVYKVLEEKMGFDKPEDKFKISRCHRLGPKRRNQSRPIIFKLHYYPDREVIWKEKRKLKNTRIFLSEDFPQEIMKKRSLLEGIAKEARSIGMEAFLSVDRLILNDKPFTVDTLKNLPPQLQPKEVYTRRSDTHTAFYSRYSPLSNFFSCQFKNEDGILFTSNEQHFQYMKAVHNDDLATARKILETEDPASCKYLGDSVKITDMKVWQDASLEIMYAGCLAKFSQSSELKEFLVSTGDTVLLEASPSDTFWGIGLRLADENVFKPECWNGSNYLGKTLRKVRDTLSK